MPVTSLDKIILPECPAAIRYYNSVNRRSKLIISTYELDGILRKGSLWFVDDSHKNVSKLPMSGGVFRFDICPDKTTLVASLTNGCISTVDLEMLTANDLLISPGSMLLSVSICDQRVVSSNNKGSVSVTDMTTETTNSFVAARLKYTNEPCEVWCTAWHNDGRYVMSGAEDALLKLWDLRCSNAEPVASNVSHESGVTFVKCEGDYCLVSGSYDENIRRFDYRYFKEPLNQSNLCGGVWNIEETSEGKLLAACMYNGWALLDKATFGVLEQTTDIGESILYGATECGDPSLIASCTFKNYAVHFHKITD